MSRSRDQVIIYLKGIDITGKTCLDVGAGPKEKWAKNFTSGIPKEYVTTDNVQFDGIDGLLDLNEDIHPLYSEKCRHFDVVFCIEVLEHIWNPINAIKFLSAVTKEVCYITTPFINPIHDEHDYLRYTLQWYEKVLKINGFREVEVTPRIATSGAETLREFYELEAMRMSKITHRLGYGKNYLDVGYIVKATK